MLIFTCKLDKIQVFSHYNRLQIMLVRKIFTKIIQVNFILLNTNLATNKYLENLNELNNYMYTKGLCLEK